MRVRLEIEVRRGDLVESRHHAQAIVCGPQGETFAASGEPGLVTTFRSAAKPFQLLPLVERGHADRWELTDEHLAVMTGSHTGSAAHRVLVAEILERIGRSDRDLACGYHDPIDPESLAHVRTHPEDRSTLYNNCSGKHAGMLCLAISEGWPTEGYQHRDHPVQQLMRSTVAEMCSMAVQEVHVGIDGCSVPVFGVPLVRMARAYARLAMATDVGDTRERALHRIVVAMTRYPRLTAGAGRFSAVLMESLNGRIVAKGGAEGLECAGIGSRGLGLAVKCEDGHGRAVGPAVVELLDACGLLEPSETARLAEMRRPAMTNYAGLVVGEITARVQISAPQTC